MHGSREPLGTPGSGAPPPGRASSSEKMGHQGGLQVVGASRPPACLRYVIAAGPRAFVRPAKAGDLVIRPAIFAWSAVSHLIPVKGARRPRYQRHRLGTSLTKGRLVCRVAEGWQRRLRHRSVGAAPSRVRRCLIEIRTDAVEAGHRCDPRLPLFCRPPSADPLPLATVPSRPEG